MYNKLKNNILKKDILLYLLSGVLITLPLKYGYGTLSIVLFLVFCLLNYKKTKPLYSIALLLPIVFYLFMVLSLLWTVDIKLTMGGLKKEIFFLLFPLAFIFVDDLKHLNLNKLLKIYTYGIVIYILFTLTNAFIRYVQTNNFEVFFYHELVTIEVNAIYVSVFVSFTLFYLLALPKRTNLEQFFLALTIVYVVLLSSKSILFIDFILVIIFYTFYSKVPKSVRLLTVFSVLAFLVMSLFYVKKIRERFLEEYETAFVDNTLNKRNIEKGKVYNVSLKQAWTNKTFAPNQYFPGTALRVFQFRVFIENIKEEQNLFNGFGLEASQSSIQQKAKKYNLYQGYGDFNFHNQYIQTFSELGLIGFLLLIGMLMINLKSAIQSKNFMHIVFAFTMIFLFLTESFFCRQRGIVFFITLYCVFHVLTQNKKEKILE